jgi:[glutamine synthetase] adenylyltransferase / [glutamine synthetase]-adenylyl-L-tyrosine phosphorylase
MSGMDTPSRQLVPSDPIDQRLQSLSEMFLASGSQYTLEEFSAAVQKHLPTLPDSRMALTNMMRFCEATVSKASLFNDVVKYPIIAEVLMTVFGSSQYFSDILVRDPELFRWLTATNVLLESPSRTDLEKKIARIEATFSHHVRRMDALKRFFRRETLRIGVRDLIGRCELQGTTHDLSLLADTIVEAALHVAEEEMKEKYQNPPSTEITVIGLGKLGGRELNYSSDIDILLVYGEEGELKGARGGTYHAYFNKLAERLIHHLTVHSAEGHFYRVDMRLRPESGAGPLTRSLHSYLLYYESRGELWERQMLIKARPIAGATELGEEFIRRLQPFVYPRTFFHHPAEEIARLKRRIEHTIAGEENIKLQAGGIRDIEFTVQALQLLHGGKTPAIRLQSTLDTISSLERHGLVAPEDARKMQRAYAFLRTIEHRLQIMMNTQTHTIPEDETALESLARNIGISSAGELRSVYAAHLQAVRKVYEEVMQVDASQEGSEILSLVEGNVSSEAVQGMLTLSAWQLAYG